MRVLKNKIQLTLEWIEGSNRSRVLGGYQAQINGDTVTIYGSGGCIVWQQAVGWNGTACRKKAAEIIQRLLQRQQ